MTWQEVVVALVAGVGAGALGSIVAPWAQHAVATRRLRQERRAAQIEAWRAMVGRELAQPTGSTDRRIRWQTTPAKLVEDQAYLTLRPHLTEEEIHAVEGRGTDMTFSVNGPPFTPAVRSLTTAIDRLERDWKLI